MIEQLNGTALQVIDAWARLDVLNLARVLGQMPAFYLPAILAVLLTLAIGRSFFLTIATLFCCAIAGLALVPGAETPQIVTTLSALAILSVLFAAMGTHRRRRGEAARLAALDEDRNRIAEQLADEIRWRLAAGDPPPRAP